jgi:spermidine/putrescine transport system ATP-binding protein/putrescine transport system ATP-binding protein
MRLPTAIATVLGTLLTVGLARHPRDGPVRGHVHRVSFFGGTSRIAVRIPGRAAPVLVHQQGPASVVPDDAVDLSWTAADAVLVPAPPA